MSHRTMRVYHASWTSTTANGRGTPWVDYTFRELNGNLSSTCHKIGVVGEFIVGEVYSVEVEDGDPITLRSSPKIVSVGVPS